MSLLADPLVILLVVIAVAAVLYYYWSGSAQRQRYRPVPIAKEGSDESHRLKKSLSEESVDCPKCGRSMDDGYVSWSGRPILEQRRAYVQCDGCYAPTLWVRGPSRSRTFDFAFTKRMGRVPNLKAYRLQ